MDRTARRRDPLADALPRQFFQASLLLLIGRRPAYGYSLRAQLEDLGVARDDWSQLYRCLRGMERAGLVVSCWEGSESGPARRTYHATEMGHAQLREWAGVIADAQDLVADFLARCSRSGAPTRQPRAGSA
ncbi:MAG: PadR family transcriptional regulator [Acidimicrobiales bacterium]